MPSAGVQLLRVAAVVALVCAAAALAAPPGRIPPALRGLARLFRVKAEAGGTVPAWKKAVAFALVLVAFALCVVG